MSMFGNFFRWLSGSFVCVKCGRGVRLFTFGYGATVCPDCYRGEQPFVFFDDRFWMNRFLMRFVGQSGHRLESLYEDSVLDHPIYGKPEIEVVG